MMVYTVTTACFILVHVCFSVFVASCSIRKADRIPRGFSCLSGSHTNMDISLHPNRLLSGRIVPAFIFVSDDCISVRAGVTPLDPVKQLRDALPWWRNASFPHHCRHLQLWVRSRERERERVLAEAVWEAGRGDSETPMEIKYSKSFTGLKILLPKMRFVYEKKCLHEMISDV